MAKKKIQTNRQKGMTVELQNIIAGGVLVTLGVLVFLSTNEHSRVGSYLSIAGEYLFGEAFRWIFSPILVLLGTMILVKKASWSATRLIGLLLFFISVTSFAGAFRQNTVGVFDLHAPAVEYFGKSAMFLIFLVMLTASLWMTLRISYRQILAKVRAKTPALVSIRDMFFPPDDEGILPKRTVDQKKKVKEIEEKLVSLQQSRPQEVKPQESKGRITPSEKPLSGKDIISRAVSSLVPKKVPIEDTSGNVIESKAPPKVSPEFGKWDFPSVQLLNAVEHKNTISPAEIEEKSLLIQKTLLQFGIDVEMEGESIGPTVIQYRLRPSEGVRLSKIEGLKKDLTLALKAKSIRIQAPIPGLGLVGIEVPNEKRDVVGIREVLSDGAFTHHKSKLALALGKDINGDYIVGDLSKMPHLLIAGQTGSGKSVGMNGFILSLLYKNTPSELRMIMVDPKQVELGVYDGIPHLLTPVINSPDKALNSLKWGVAEMERRLTVFKGVNARNLEEYNAKVSQKDAQPVIVIIIDELADLMMSGNKKEVESSITRIAQKARAAGIHLILATQRPSVDVITGLIKANVPSRVAFTVASGIDSRTILDSYGAEDLLGRGDMLYFPTGAMSANRLQGVLVETDEVERVVAHIKRTIDPAMLEDIYDHSVIAGDRGNWEGSVGGGEGFDEDPKVIEEAIELVRSSGKCSTSMIQRHMKLGYGRAARVVDILENLGIVGPADGSKPREVIG